MQALNSQTNEMEMAIIRNSSNLDKIFEVREGKNVIWGCSNPEGENNLAEIIKKYIKSGRTLEKKFIQDVFISALNRCDNPFFLKLQ